MGNSPARLSWVGEFSLKYPYFQSLYNDLYRLCENLEDVMGYYSEALQKMDRDTVQYMIEEQEKEIEELKSDKEELKNDNDKLRNDIEELKKEKEKMAAELQSLRNSLK